MSKNDADEAVSVVSLTSSSGGGDTEQSRLESTTEITQNKHVKVLHYFVDDIYKLILLMF